jgi:hypothetical protein
MPQNSGSFLSSLPYRFDAIRDIGQGVLTIAAGVIAAAALPTVGLSLGGRWQTGQPKFPNPGAGGESEAAGSAPATCRLTLRNCAQLAVEYEAGPGPDGSIEQGYFTGPK